MVAPLLPVAILLGLSMAEALNFTSVYKWPELDYVWPSEENRTAALEEYSFFPQSVYSRYMAAFGERLFLSLHSQGATPSLVSLPTRSSTPPKLSPFPSWALQEKGDCGSIQSAQGIETDTNGRLWLVDEGSERCKPKLWIFDLSDADRVHLVHEFPDSVVAHNYLNRYLRSIVLDETPDDWIAYVTDSRAEHVVAFSLTSNHSWSVPTPGNSFLSAALSPKAHDRRLYLGKYGTNELYSVSAAELRAKSANATASFVGNLTGQPYKLLISNDNVLYAGFYDEQYIWSWNLTQPLNKPSFYHEEKQSDDWPVNFALDATGAFWSMRRTVNDDGKKESELLKAETNAKSYLFSAISG